MFLLLLILELVKEREREREDVSRWSKNYKKLNLRKINFSEFRIYRTYYHYYTIITIDRSRNEESFFVPFFFLLSPRAGENDRTIQETGAINVSKSARARERESDQRIPCVGKKGRSARSLARVRYWNETNPRLPRGLRAPY